jgi:hypothetical protein
MIASYAVNGAFIDLGAVITNEVRSSAGNISGS